MKEPGKNFLHGPRGERSASRLIAIIWSVVFMIRILVLSILGVGLGMPDAVCVVASMVSMALVKFAEGKHAPEFFKGLLHALGTTQMAGNVAEAGSVQAVIKAIGHNVWPDNKTDDETGT